MKSTMNKDPVVNHKCNNSFAYEMSPAFLEISAGLKLGSFHFTTPPVTTKLTLCLSNNSPEVVPESPPKGDSPRPRVLHNEAEASWSLIQFPRFAARSPSRERWFPTGWRSWKGKFLALAAEISHL